MYTHLLFLTTVFNQQHYENSIEFFLSAVFTLVSRKRRHHYRP